MRTFRKLIGLLLIIAISLSIGYYYGQKQGNTSNGNLLNKFFSVASDTKKVAKEKITSKIPKSEVSSSSSKETVENTEADLAIIEARIHELVNQERTAHELTALTIEPQLVKASRQRSKEIVADFSHERSGESSFSIFKEPEYRYIYQAVGENIVMATYQGTPKEMGEYFFKLWKESPGHYENMMSPKFSEVGTGVYLEDGILYGTQLFGHPRN